MPRDSPPLCLTKREETLKEEENIESEFQKNAGKKY